MQNRFSSVTVCEDFDFAIRIAALRAKPGQSVLLSPASASFDRFANYEERGDRFVEIVRAIKEERTRKTAVPVGFDNEENAPNFDEFNGDEEEGIVGFEGGNCEETE